MSTYTDLGPLITTLITNPTPYLNTCIPVVSDYLTLSELVAIYTRVTGQPARATTPTPPLGINGVPVPQPLDLEKATRPEIEFYQNAVLMAMLNQQLYFDGNEGIMDVAKELVGASVKGGLTGWEKWVRELGFDVKKEGMGDGVKRAREKWGGRLFV